MEDMTSKEYDVFFSYETSTSSELVRKLAEVLEGHGLKCWYAKNNITIGKWRKQIYEALDSCRVFILLLNRAASLSDEVDDEIENAIVLNRKGDLELLPIRCDNEIEPSLDRHLLRYQQLDWTSGVNEQAISQLFEYLKGVLPDRFDDSGNVVQTARTANKYYELYGDESDQEAKWLHVQQEMLRSYDAPVFQKIFNDIECHSVLDLGTNDGFQLVDRLASCDSLEFALGIDVNPNAIRMASEAYADDSRYLFEEADCEAASFSDYLESRLAQAGKKGFDLVILSMVLLHLKNPFKLLRVVRKHMNRRGYIFIRDIDDGFNIAYPDDEGYFARLNRLCGEITTTGFRFSGRQLLEKLTRAGFKDISFEGSGISTVGMDQDQRSALLSASFGWLGGDLRLRAKNNPDNDEYQQDADWFEETYDEIEERFLDVGFFYHEGYVIYTARK